MFKCLDCISRQISFNYHVTSSCNNFVTGGGIRNIVRTDRSCTVSQLQNVFSDYFTEVIAKGVVCLSM